MESLAHSPSRNVEPDRLIQSHSETERLAKAVKPDAVAHKWQVFQDLHEARELLGATDRALAILNALLTFHPEIALTGGVELIHHPP